MLLWLRTTECLFHRCKCGVSIYCQKPLTFFDSYRICSLLFMLTAVMAVKHFSIGVKIIVLCLREMICYWVVHILRTDNKTSVEFFAGRNLPATVVVRVGNNRPDLGTNPICNRFTGQLEEGKPLFLPCNPPMPGAFVSVHLEGASLSQLSICEAFVYTDQVTISNSGYCLEHIRHSCVDYALFAATLSCVSTQTYTLLHTHTHTHTHL